MPKSKKVWVVVHVASGIPAEVKTFADGRAAARQKRRWRKKINPEDDEVGVFRVRIK